MLKVKNVMHYVFRSMPVLIDGYLEVNSEAGKVCHSAVLQVICFKRNIHVLKIRSNLFITHLFKPYQKDNMKFLYDFSSCVLGNALFLDLQLDLV